MRQAGEVVIAHEPIMDRVHGGAISETLNRSLVKLRSMGQTCVIPQIEAPLIARLRCRANCPWWSAERGSGGGPSRDNTRGVRKKV